MLKVKIFQFKHYAITTSQFHFTALVMDICHLNNNSCAFCFQGPLQWLVVNATTTSQVIPAIPNVFYKVAVATELGIFMDTLDGQSSIPINTGIKWSHCSVVSNQGK